MAGITKLFLVTIKGYLSYLLPEFEDLVPTSLGSGAIWTRCKEACEHGRDQSCNWMFKSICPWKWHRRPRNELTLKVQNLYPIKNGSETQAIYDWPIFLNKTRTHTTWSTGKWLCFSPRNVSYSRSLERPKHTGWLWWSATWLGWLRFGMFHHSAWAVGSYSSGPRTLGQTSVQEV